MSIERVISDDGREVWVVKWGSPALSHTEATLQWLRDSPGIIAGRRMIREAEAAHQRSTGNWTGSDYQEARAKASKLVSAKVGK